MKWNGKAVFSAVMEYVVLVCPPIGYALFAYITTLQTVLTESQKGSFWALFGLAIATLVVALIAQKRAKTLYDRFTAAYVQQKADLEIHPENELLIKKVEEKAKIVESLDYIAIGMPLLIVTLVLYIFRSAITEVIGILGMCCVSLFGKAGLHSLTLKLKADGMRKNIPKAGDE